MLFVTGALCATWRKASANTSQASRWNPMEVKNSALPLPVGWDRLSKVIPHFLTLNDSLIFVRQVHFQITAASTLVYAVVPENVAVVPAFFDVAEGFRIFLGLPDESRKADSE